MDSKNRPNMASGDSEMQAVHEIQPQNWQALCFEEGPLEESIKLSSFPRFGGKKTWCNQAIYITLDGTAPLSLTGE